MDFFRSAALRRIMYAIAFALAVVRLANRAHSEELPVQVDVPAAASGQVHIAPALN